MFRARGSPAVTASLALSERGAGGRHALGSQHDFAGAARRISVAPNGSLPRLPPPRLAVRGGARRDRRLHARGARASSTATSAGCARTSSTEDDGTFSADCVYEATRSSGSRSTSDAMMLPADEIRPVHRVRRRMNFGSLLARRALVGRDAGAGRAAHAPRGRRAARRGRPRRRRSGQVRAAARVRGRARRRHVRRRTGHRADAGRVHGGGRRGRPRELLVIDTYERLRLLDDWLRHTYLPSLPETDARRARDPRRARRGVARDVRRVPARDPARPARARRRRDRARARRPRRRAGRERQPLRARPSALAPARRLRAEGTPGRGHPDRRAGARRALPRRPRRAHPRGAR